MIYRKQKRWIEFILRLLPFIIIFLYIFGLILAYQKTGTLHIIFDSGLNGFFNSIFDDFNNYIFNLDNMSGFGPLFYNFYLFIQENISDNSLILFIVLISVYQVMISLILLLFDFVNFIIEFARKWLNGLYGKE